MTVTPHHSKKQVAFGIGIVLLLFITPYIGRYLGIISTEKNIYTLLIHELYVWVILFAVYLYATRIEKRPLLDLEGKLYSS